ncbi:OsmC family protein [Pseudonocardia nigra]|uniref:OsmC family protein n=1 Tax=Pseudonocardia nigra TaxID=1921578 RepID=UPI001FE7E5A2|nr:OsmC family protein [Pseudonocardia nigra]
MQAPLAAADARLASGASRAVDLRMGPHELTADHTEAGDGRGPTPLELMTASLAACSAMSARSHLERDGDPGDIEVVATLDAGPPTLLYRRVLLAFRLDADEAHRLADALERTEVTMMLRPAFTIRTVIEHAGEPLV